MPTPPTTPRPELRPAIAIIGGSGLYEFPGFEDVQEVELTTPFGAPSDRLRVGRLAGKRVIFLARHGRGHTLLPSEINARANVWALKALGARQIIAVSAVGSLVEAIAPGDVVLPRQFIDRTHGRPATFFGEGVVAHVAFADPICGALSDAMADVAETLALARVHRGGTYLCIEGPQFSTRAESRLWQAWGAQLVGMTNLPEARLAREAELCYATLALPTDYDAWREESADKASAHVTASSVVAVLRSLIEKSQRIVAATVARLDPARPCACQHALDDALMTAPETLAPETLAPEARTRLSLVLRRVLAARTHA